MFSAACGYFSASVSSSSKHVAVMLSTRYVVRSEAAKEKSPSPTSRTLSWERKGLIGACDDACRDRASEEEEEEEEEDLDEEVFCLLDAGWSLWATFFRDARASRFFAVPLRTPALRFLLILADDVHRCGVMVRRLNLVV